MRVIADNLECRGHEVKVSETTKSKYALVYVEESDGRGSNIICYDLEIAAQLKKGQVYNFICELKRGKFTQFEITGYVEVELEVPVELTTKKAV